MKNPDERMLVGIFYVFEKVDYFSPRAFKYGS